MSRIKLASLGGIAIIAVVSLAIPGNALACGIACLPPRAAPSGGASIPGNVQLIAFDPGNWYQSQQGIDVRDGGVRLFDQDWKEVPLSVRDDPQSAGDFLLDAPLVSGATYHLRYVDPCVNLPPAGADAGDIHIGLLPIADAGWYETSFDVGPTAAGPIAAGQLTIIAQSVGAVQAATVCGSCTRPIAAAYADIAFDPAADLIPFLPVTSFSVLVDGVQWARVGYGRLRADGGIEGWSLSRREPFRIFAACHPSAGWGEDNGVTPGPHAIQVAAHIAGGSSDPPVAATSVMLDCTGWESVIVPPACWHAGSDAGAGSSDDAGAGSSDGCAPSGEQGPGKRGCSGSLAAVAVVLGAFFAKERTRRAHH